jgi:hypothetical protein
MSTMVTEVYEALRDAGASEAKATAAAQALVLQFVARDSTEFSAKADIFSLRDDLRAETSKLDKRLSVVETRLGVTEKLLWGVLLGVVALVVKAYLPV